MEDWGEKWVGFDGACVLVLAYWFTQQYNELQPPGGDGGAVTISPIDLSGCIGCGEYGGSGITVLATTAGAVVCHCGMRYNRLL